MRQLPKALAPLAGYAQFVLRKGKMPVDYRTGTTGDAQDPGAWLTAETAIKTASLYGPEYGIGFVFTESDPFFFLDIDGCLSQDGKQWTTAAQGLTSRLPGAAVEVSQSGKGLHLFGRYTGAAPDHACKNIPQGIELYTSGRFVALTGDRAAGSAETDCTVALAGIVATYFQPRVSDTGQDWTTEPVSEYTGPTDDDKLIKQACSAKSAGSAFGGATGFKALWEADEDVLGASYPDAGDRGRSYDDSSADAALAQHLAFWTGKNCERMLGLMKRSALVRDKWEREDYLIRTILKAASMQETVYSVGSGGEAATGLKGSKAQQDFAAQVRANKLAECHGDAETVAILSVKTGPVTESNFWLENKDKSAAELAAMVKPIKSATDPMGGQSGPEITTGYQYLGPTQQTEYFNGCVYIQDEHRVFIPSGALLKAEQFNATYGGYVFQLEDSGNKSTKKAFEAFTESQVVRYRKAESTCFRPDQPPGAIIKRDGRQLVNIYTPVVTARTSGDPAPFLKHLALILPEKHDQAILMAYLAACVQHKGVKFQWAPLLQGVEGNGKTLFTRCVAAAIGEKYVHMPPASEISEKFNAWLFDKLFIGVEDIYVPDQKRELIEVLKPMITNERLPCRAMQQAQVMKDCCANFLFNSNHKDGVRKTQNDRRFATFFTGQQLHCHLERDGMVGDYFPDLYKWLRSGGYAIVTDFLYSYEIPDELNPATSCHRAPVTSTTDVAIQAGLGGVEQEILEAIDEDRPGFAGGWVSSAALENMLKMMRRETSIPHNKRRDLLISLGYDWHPALKQGRVNNIVMPDGKKPRLFIKIGHIANNIESPAAVAKAYEEAQSAAMVGAGTGKAAEVFNSG